MTVLCEMCGNEFSGLRVEWRRGFTAVCCVSCAGELHRFLREDFIKFNPASKKMFAVLIRNKRPSWDEASQHVFEERRELWEKLAAA